MGEAMEEEDRLSLLQEELLSHILTYLDSMVAVQTCVLSKRWVNLWKTLPCLNFRITSPSFIVDKFDFNRKFVTNFLSCRIQDSILKTIKVGSSGCKDISATCLDYANSHNVEHLSLRHGDFSDAHCLNSASIKTLHLSNCVNFPSIEDWVLPSLTSLYLWNVWVGDYIFGFQNLKELTLSGCSSCSLDFDEVLTIDCPNLESLSLGPENTYRDIVFYTPKLSYFEFRSDHLPHLCAGVPQFSASDGFPCIKEVDIDIKINNSGAYLLVVLLEDGDHSGGDLLVDGDGDQIMAYAISNFISMLDAVRETPVLKLSSETIQFLRRVPDFSEYQPSPLCNLKFLYLQGVDDEMPTRTTDYVINYLLTNSPHAEILEGY